MRHAGRPQDIFNVEMSYRTKPLGSLGVVLPSARAGDQIMMTIKNRNVVAALRRDVNFVWHAAIAVVFVCFAGLALAAAVIDLMALRH